MDRPNKIIDTIVDSLVSGIQRAIDFGMKRWAVPDDVDDYFNSLIPPALPHCDPAILHAPGTCTVCDEFPTLQRYRELAGINFTNEDLETRCPCPSEYFRDPYDRDAWKGNLPVPQAVEGLPPTVTTNPDDPALDVRQINGQNAKHLVLVPDGETPYLRPVRNKYTHKACGGVTTIPPAIASTFALDPTFYGSTFCAVCKAYLPVSWFVWHDGTTVGE